MIRIFKHTGKIHFALLAAFCLPMNANADFTFFSNQTSVQPDEMVGFNNPMLVNVGTTVEGMTSQSGTIIEFTSNDMPADQLITLPAMPGMQGMPGLPNRIVSQDGRFSSIVIDAQESGDYFSELGFNVARVMGAPNPTFSLTIIDQFGNAFVDDFEDNVLNPGPNFFSVSGFGGSLIDRAILTASSENIRDIRQIAITVVPEPSLVSVFSVVMAGMLLKRRKK